VARSKKGFQTLTFKYLYFENSKGWWCFIFVAQQFHIFASFGSLEAAGLLRVLFMVDKLATAWSFFFITQRP
jgi:hypothetical protein